MEFKNDPKVSFILPIYNVPLDVLKRCFLSIVDQDYQNIEVVACVNGGDRDAEALALEFAKDRPNWKVLFTEEKGASPARNWGFRESTGEIVSFFSSDCILKPGIVRVWVDALLANPDCGFVYGAYEYSTMNRDVYPSKPFDVFQLDVANYIDAAFPLWRKHVVEWDPEVKSLQDWDFWLRVVKSCPDKCDPLCMRGRCINYKTVKGHFLGREISFIAAPPRSGGLSHDSGDNWTDRVKFIKDKNGIPERSICVVSLGAPNHGVEIAKMLPADYRDDTLHKPHAYRALYLIGWYMNQGGAHNGHSRVIEAFKHSKRIVHWVGADVYKLRDFSTAQIRGFAGALKMSTTAILCENELAQKELASYGIEAEVVPIPSYSEWECRDLPKQFSVAVYLTDRSDFDKYLKAHTLSIVKAMPDVKFYGYGDGDVSHFKGKNFEHKGTLTRTEWEQFVYDRAAYLRLVRHDTRPMATDEFLMAGRSVVSNIPNDFVEYVDTSGNLPVDSWDTFAPGFSAARWPSTKKKIVQAIRKVRREQTQKDRAGIDFEGERIARAISVKVDLDKDRYRQKIRDLALSTELEVVRA